MRLKQAWSAVPVGEIYPVHFAAGDVLSGELLERAAGLGLVEEEQPDDGKPTRGKRPARG